MTDYNSEEDMPFDVESANLNNTFTFPFAPTGGQPVDNAGFPVPPAQVDSAGFPIPFTPTTSASSASNQVTDTNVFSTPPRTKRSDKSPKTPDTISSKQDEKETGIPNNFYKEYEQEGTNNSTSHSDSSADAQENSREGRNKRCQAFKTRSAIMIAVVLLLVLITILVVAVLFLSGEKVDDVMLPSPTASTPLETVQPVTSPSLGPATKVTPPPTSPPTRTAPAPDASLDVPIRNFLFDESDVSVEPINPVAQKAFEWLVDEANQAGSLIFPLDPKYRQRFGILTIYFSVNPNGQAANSDLRLPSPLMMNQDECAWRGMECDENGLLTEIKLQNLGLDGTLPSVWGFFPNLKSIDFSKNQLVGGIPEGLYDVLGLEELYLYKNRLGGTISSKIGNLWDLKRFHLSHNRISGSIPPELASTSNKVRKLRSFNVHRNQMTGSIPSNMRLRQLYYLDLGDNQFSDTLPPDLGTESVRLRHLYLDHNNFMGTFPSEILNAGDGRLKTLSLNDNQFIGTFPGDHDKSNSIMVELTIQNNNFVALGGGSLCYLDSLTGGELVEFKSDCSICLCTDTFLCRACWQY